MVRSLCFAVLFLFVSVTHAPFASAGCVDRLIEWFSHNGTPRIGADAHTLRDIQDLRSTERRTAAHKYAAPSPKTWVGKSIVIADWAMGTLLALRIASGMVADPKSIFTSLLLAPAAMFSADLVSQLFHKWLDSWASEQNPLWGDAAREFRKHHEVPDNLNQVDPLSHITAFGPLMFPLFVSANVVSWSPELGSAVWLFLIATLHATEFHRQAHLRTPNAFFGFLQSTRLALRRETHLAHHRPPFDENYAVVNGWSHFLTRRLDLWNRLDRLFYRVTRKMPHQWLQAPESIPPDIMQDLITGAAEIPAELWDYTQVAYPDRISEELSARMQRVRPLCKPDLTFDGSGKSEGVRIRCQAPNSFRYGNKSF